MHAVGRGSGLGDHGPRTSLDLELDLQASQTKLRLQQEELARLRDLKARMEDLKTQAGHDLPSWFADNEQLQLFLEEAEKMVWFLRYLEYLILHYRG